jgi:seryl-tRNA synthetase
MKNGKIKEGKMSKKIGIGVMSFLFVGSVLILSQASVNCGGQLQQLANQYNSCKSELSKEVSSKLLPLIAQRDALKKEVEGLKELKDKYADKKKEITDRINALVEQIKQKQCVNCTVTTQAAAPTTGGGNTSVTTTTTAQAHPSCRLPNICSVCQSLVDQATGKSLCEVCGCKR